MFVFLPFKGSLSDKQEAQTTLFVLCVSLSCLGVIFAKTGGVLTFVLTLAAVARKQKPKSTLLPSRRKPGAAPPLGETTSRFAQIAKTAIWLSGRLGEEGFKNAGQGHNDKFRFIFPQHFTQSEASASPYFTQSEASVSPFFTQCEASASPCFTQCGASASLCFTRSDFREATAVEHSELLPCSEAPLPLTIVQQLLNHRSTPLHSPLPLFNRLPIACQRFAHRLPSPCLFFSISHL